MFQINLFRGLTPLLVCFVAKPEAPSIISVMPYSSRAVVRWKFADNGGLPLVSLTLEYRVNTDKKWQSLQLTPADRKQYTITELEPDTNYQFRIRAENKLGRSEASVAYIAQTSKPGRLIGTHHRNVQNSYITRSLFTLSHADGELVYHSNVKVFYTL